MNKKQYIQQIAKQFFHRQVEPTAGDKRFQRVLLLSAGVFLLSLCVLLLSGLATFSVWLMYGALFTMVSVEYTAIIWRIWDIAQRMKEDERSNSQWSS